MRHRHFLSFLPRFAGAALLVGCTLVDQRSFDRHAGRVPVPRAPTMTASGPAPIPPLLVVRDASSTEAWRQTLREAVAEALARKPRVLFTVQSVVPVAGSPEAQADALRTVSGREGIAVADAILADGAHPSQIEMQAASDPALQRPEVRITVR